MSDQPVKPFQGGVWQLVYNETYSKSMKVAKYMDINRWHNISDINPVEIWVLKVTSEQQQWQAIIYSMIAGSG